MKFPQEKFLLGFSVSTASALMFGFVLWLFNVEKSITTIKSNQAFLAESMNEVKIDIREIRKGFEEVLGRIQSVERNSNDSDHYAVENRHIQ